MSESIVIIETATLLDAGEKTELTALAQSFAKESIAVEFKLVPKLLGGFTIKFNDRKFDASLKNELSQLVTELKGHSNG
jgi:F0F1-type ATP synthase delta subunit